MTAIGKRKFSGHAEIKGADKNFITTPMPKQLESSKVEKKSGAEPQEQQKDQFSHAINISSSFSREADKVKTKKRNHAGELKHPVENHIADGGPTWEKIVHVNQVAEGLARFHGRKMEAIRKSEAECSRQTLHSNEDKNKDCGPTWEKITRIKDYQ